MTFRKTFLSCNQNSGFQYHVQQEIKKGNELSRENVHMMFLCNVTQAHLSRWQPKDAGGVQAG